MLSLCFLFRVARWSRQRNGKRRLSRSPESRERAEPGGHGGRGLDIAGPEASEGCLLFLLRQPSREPQKEEEQEQTQVHNPDMKHICVSGYLFLWNLLTSGNSHMRACECIDHYWFVLILKDYILLSSRWRRQQFCLPVIAVALSRRHSFLTAVQYSIGGQVDTTNHILPELYCSNSRGFVIIVTHS